MYKMFDLHNDYFTTKKFATSKQSYLNKINKLGVSTVTAIWTTNMHAEKALSTIESANKLVSNGGNGLLGIEDLHFATKPTLNEIINYNPVYCGLTWNHDNNLAGGAMESGDLTEFGKYAVKQLESADIFVDTAHLNERSFMSFANITTKPMLCTHTACHNLISHARNLKDYQLKIIADSGGLIGICLVSDFLSGRKYCTILDYVCHIDYAVNKFGIDHVAIGTDFYGTKNLPAGITDYKSLQKALVENLTKLGYKPKDINKIFYQNAADFFNLSDMRFFAFSQNDTL